MLFYKISSRSTVDESRRPDKVLASQCYTSIVARIEGAVGSRRDTWVKGATNGVNSSPSRLVGLLPRPTTPLQRPWQQEGTGSHYSKPPSRKCSFWCVAAQTASGETQASGDTEGAVQ